MDAPRHTRHGGPARHRGVRVWLAWRRAWHDFTFLLFPISCVVCGDDDARLCPACAHRLRRGAAHPFRAEDAAGALTTVGGRALLPVVAAGRYRDTLATVLLAYKNHGQPQLGVPVARLLAEALRELPRLVPELAGRPLVLVPVPSTGASWRRRGYDPVAVLVHVLRRERLLPAGLSVAALLRCRVRVPGQRRRQKSLGRTARRHNVRHAFAVRRRGGGGIWPSANLYGARVVLLDDVLTSGATLREAARTLENSGATVCAAVVVAAATTTPGVARQGSADDIAEKYLSSKDEYGSPVN